MRADAAGAGRGRRLGPIAALLALVAFAAFNANGREIPSYDSQPTKFLALEIAKRHTLSLGHVVGRVPALGTRSAFAQDLHGNYRSAYPLPSASPRGRAGSLSAVHQWTSCALAAFIARSASCSGPASRAPFCRKRGASTIAGRRYWRSDSDWAPAGGPG